jgi:DNA invertase Pin-like site-specific DNA recombinase
MYLYYSRISTVSQNAARQLASFKAHGHVQDGTHGHINAENVFIDKIQGDVPFFQRPEAVKLYDIATITTNSEVTIIIDSIDRLGRNLLDILNTIKVLSENGINLKSLKEGFETLVNGKDNPLAAIVISVMGTVAEMERDKIKERTSEGILLAKAEGKYKGRKAGSVQTKEQLLTRYPIVVQKLRKGFSIREVAKISSNSSATVMKVKKALLISP